MINGWDTIEPRRLLLQDAMPVQGGAFFGPSNVIAHINRNGVSPVGFDGGGREGSINEQSTSIHSIRRNEASSDVKIVSRPGSWNAVQLLPDRLKWSAAYQ